MNEIGIKYLSVTWNWKFYLNLIKSNKWNLKLHLQFISSTIVFQKDLKFWSHNLLFKAEVLYYEKIKFNFKKKGLHIIK